MITESSTIKVYNYGVNVLSVTGQNREYLFEGSRNGIPTMHSMPFSDVEFINARTPVIQNGALRFAENEQDEVYKSLYLPNWKSTVYFDEEIIETILDADASGLQRFLDVKDIFTIERIRAHMIGLSNSKDHDISNRVIELIEKRRDEINKGIRDTNISLVKTKANIESDRDPRVSELEKQVEEMKKLMEQMVSATEKKSAKASKKTTSTKDVSEKTEQPEP